jgi:hypothetical protein
MIQHDSMATNYSLVAAYLTTGGVGVRIKPVFNALRKEDGQLSGAKVCPFKYKLGMFSSLQLMHWTTSA